jgi:hypothetical protein
MRRVAVAMVVIVLASAIASRRHRDTHADHDSLP